MVPVALCLLSFFAANAPLFVLDVLRGVLITMREAASQPVVAALCLAALAAVTAHCRTLPSPCDPGVNKNRAPGLSCVKGLCLLAVGIIHSAPAAELDALLFHRHVVDHAVPVLLLCLGMTSRRATFTVEWFGRRATSVVPSTLVCVSLIWIHKLQNGFLKTFRFLGGHQPRRALLATFVCRPDCVGGLWFVPVYAQCVLASPLVARHPLASLPLLFVLSVSMRLNADSVAAAPPTISSPCDADGLMYTITHPLKHLVLISLGACADPRTQVGSTAMAASLLAGSCLLRVLCGQEFPTLYAVSDVVQPVLLARFLLRLFSTYPVDVLHWIGDHSYDFYLGHVLALNVFMKDFTTDQYRLPWMAGARPIVFWILSCATGVAVRLIHRLAHHRERGHVLRAAAAVIVVLPAFLMQLQMSSTTVAAPPLFASPPPSAAVDPPPPAQAESRASSRDSRAYSPPRLRALQTSRPFAFFTLVRGGSHETDLASYAERSRLLKPYRTDRVDDIAFHEGNVPAGVQSAVGKRLDVRFVNLREYGGFEVPQGTRLFPIRTPGSYSTGYRHMCRFFALQWMHILRGYEAVMRIDEDVLVHSMESSPFGAMTKAPDLVYAYALETGESHEETVNTLRVWMPRHYPDAKIDVSRMFFTNVFLTRVDWWLRDDVQDFLRKVDASGNIYLHRWGDAPIQTIALKLFQAKTQLFRVDYSHGSTSNEIKAGREVRYTKAGGMPASLRSVFAAYDRAAPCLVASSFGLAGPLAEKEACTLLRDHIMLDTGLPKAVVDTLSCAQAASAYQEDVKGSEGPLPTSSLAGTGRLDQIAKSVGAAQWTTDAEMLSVVQAHPCGTHVRLASARKLQSSAGTRLTAPRQQPAAEQLGSAIAREQSASGGSRTARTTARTTTHTTTHTTAQGAHGADIEQGARHPWGVRTTGKAGLAKHMFTRGTSA